MAITNPSELKTAVADYLARADLTTYIPDFIVGAETRINFGCGNPLASEALRNRAMETSANITFSASGTSSLPASFLQMRRAYWSANPNRAMEQVSPEQFYGTWVGTETGSAIFYIIEGENIVTGPQEAGTMKALYYKKFEAIGSMSAAGSNWLLANSPHTYVYGALLEAAPFLHNDERLQLWHGLYTASISGLMNADKRDRWGGSTMAIRRDGGHY